MKTKLTGVLAFPACLGLLFGMTASAQDKPAETYIYGNYSVCDLDKQDRADEIYAQVEKPILDAAVTSGMIKGYGHYAHHTGGRWRRLQYFSASSVEDLLTSQKKLGDQSEAANKKLGDEAAGICNAHDDYIWRRVAGTSGSTSPGGFVFSTYYVCDSSREDQADALVQQVMAPIYDKMVAEGKLKSWGWLEHIVGGQYRRVDTIGAADLGSLMAARGALIEAFEDNAAGDAFTSICGSHTDYIWEVKHSNP
jgi:hypothetical protein